MNKLKIESQSYETEVDREAAGLVRAGEAAPWEAVTRAHLRIQRRRQHAERERGQAAKGGGGK